MADYELVADRSSMVFDHSLKAMELGTDIENGFEDGSFVDLPPDIKDFNEKQENEGKEESKDIIVTESAINREFSEAELLTTEQPPSTLPPQINSTKELSSERKDEREETNLFVAFLYAYMRKFTGVPGKAAPAMTRPVEMCISSLLAFIGIFLVALTDRFYLNPSFSAGHSNSLPIQMLTGAYAATSVLIYEAYQSPLAQPKNVLGSYTICSFVGVSTRLVCDIIGIPRYVTGALAVSIAIFFMNITKTVHPPGK